MVFAASSASNSTSSTKRKMALMNVRWTYPGASSTTLVRGNDRAAAFTRARDSAAVPVNGNGVMLCPSSDAKDDTQFGLFGHGLSRLMAFSPHAALAARTAKMRTGARTRRLYAERATYGFSSAEL
jgi:hypothetical protein